MLTNLGLSWIKLSRCWKILNVVRIHTTIPKPIYINIYYLEASINKVPYMYITITNNKERDIMLDQKTSPSLRTFNVHACMFEECNTIYSLLCIYIYPFCKDNALTFELILVIELLSTS